MVDGAVDPWKFWEHVPRFGTTLDEIARNVVAEWVAQGEPEVTGYDGIAFTLPYYIDSEENRRKKPRSDD